MRRDVTECDAKLRDGYENATMQDDELRQGCKTSAKDPLCRRRVAGAPACPCLPGAQRLPQQALPPGSKDHMKRALSLRRERPAGFCKNRLQGAIMREEVEDINAHNET